MRNIGMQGLTDRKRLFFFISMSFVLLYFIFSPATHILYYGGEDFRYAVGGTNRLCKQDDGFYFMRTLGRPLQAYMDCMVYKVTQTLAHMVVLRIFAVFLLGLGMGLLADWLYMLGFSYWSAFFAAGCLLLIQKLYSDTILTAAISLIVPILFVLLAYRCLSQAHQYVDSFASNAKAQKRKCFFIASLFLLSALLTYPAMTFFFGTLVLLKLLFSNLQHWSKTRREVLQEMLLFVAVCIIYFIWASYNMRYHAHAPIPEQYRMHFNLNIMEIFERTLPLLNVFTGGPWVLLFPLGFPLGANFQGYLTIILIVGAIVFAWTRFSKGQFYLQNRQQALLTLTQAVIAVLILLFFSSAFYLLIPNKEDMGSRLIFASVASGFPILFWSIYRWGDIFSAHFKPIVVSLIIGIIFFLEGYQANVKIMYDALHYAHTLNLTKTQIAHYLMKKNALRRIHFIIPEPEHPYNKFFLANAALVQLAGPGSYLIKWCSLPRGMPGAEKDHTQEMLTCVGTLPLNGIAITYTRPGEPIKKSEKMLLMSNQMANQSDELRNLIL